MIHTGVQSEMVGKMSAQGNEPAKTASQTSDEDKIKVARQFEAIFVRQLLGQMQVKSSEGMGADMYQGMSDDAMAEHITEHSEGFGIAHSLLKHWGVKPAP
jgi:flagellar protein FlgJ